MNERVKGRRERERERERERDLLLTVETVHVVEADHQPFSIVRVDVVLNQHLFQLRGSHQEQRIQRQTITEQGLK